MKKSAILGATAALLLAGVSCAAADQPEGMRVVQHISGPDGGWDYAAYDAQHHAIFVSRTDGVLKIDTATGAATPRFVPGQGLHSSIALPGGLGLSTNGRTNSATLFDAGSGKVLAEIPTGTNPDAATYDPASGLVFVMNGRSGDITPIDPKAMKALPAIPVGGKLEFAAPDGAGRIYVNIEDKGEIAVIDTKTRQVVTHWTLPGCEEPSGLDYGAGTVISVCGNEKAELVSIATGEVVKTVAIGKGPDAVMWDRAHKLAFVPCGRDGVLDVISVEDPKNARLVATVPTQTGARTGALDTDTGRIYLPTAKFTPPPAAGQRPSMVPGSFEVLVVGR